MMSEIEIQGGRRLGHAGGEMRIVIAVVFAAVLCWAPFATGKCPCESGTACLLMIACLVVAAATLVFSFGLVRFSSKDKKSLQDIISKLPP